MRSLSSGDFYYNEILIIRRYYYQEIFISRRLLTTCGKLVSELRESQSPGFEIVSKESSFGKGEIEKSEM